MAVQQQVSVVVKIPDDRNVHARVRNTVDNFRDGRRGFVSVDRDAYELRPGIRERDDLVGRRGGVRRVGVGHRLHDNGMPGAYRDIPDSHRDCLSSSVKRHYAASLS
jgi:hypothetical protein